MEVDIVDETDAADAATTRSGTPTPTTTEREGRRGRGRGRGRGQGRGRGGERGRRGGRRGGTADTTERPEPSVPSATDSLFFALVESYLLTAHPSTTREQAEDVILRDLRGEGDRDAVEEDDPRSIREAQDVEFLHASRIDAQKQEEREERDRAQEFERRRREAILSRDPPEEEYDTATATETVTIMLRMPGGDRPTRRFSATTSLDSLFRWVDALILRPRVDAPLHYIVPSCSSLVSRDPAMKFVAADEATRASTFAEVGVADKSVFFVEATEAVETASS